MKNKTIFGSIIALFLIMSMPMISNIQAKPQKENIEIQEDICILCEDTTNLENIDVNEIRCMIVAGIKTVALYLTLLIPFINIPSLKLHNPMYFYNYYFNECING